MSSEPVYINLEFTPNPNTLKYSVNRSLLDRGGINLRSKEEAAKKSPLAAKLFEVPGICGVMIGRDFVTVTKSEEGDWDLVHKSAASIIEQHLSAKEPVVNSEALQAAAEKGGDSEVEKKIRQILDHEIRPAVAMDGGDITFERYEDGIVYVYLQGACSGCPSSTMTLKMGIERRLQEEIPEVREVVSI